MNTILGKWRRPGVDLNITKDKVITRVLDDVDYRTLVHDYLLEAGRLKLYSPTVREVKYAFKGEMTVIMLTAHDMQMEMQGTVTHWTRRSS